MEMVWIKTWILTVTICSAQLSAPCPQQLMNFAHYFSEAECLAAKKDAESGPTVSFDKQGTKTTLQPHEVAMTCMPGAMNIDAYPTKDAALKAKPRQWVTAEDGTAHEVTEIKNKN